MVYITKQGARVSIYVYRVRKCPQSREKLLYRKNLSAPKAVVSRVGCSDASVSGCLCGCCEVVGLDMSLVNGGVG